MEKEKVFSRYWVYAGHVNAISEPGDHFTRTIGGKQIIVTCDYDRTVRAFYNVCAHRGSKMLEDTPPTEPGSMNRITRPDHSGRTNLTVTSRVCRRVSERPALTQTSKEF